jgi:acyl carrier protein
MSLPPREAILGEFTKLLRRICEHDEMEIAAGTLLDDIPGIDSLRLLQAVAHLEDHFHVEIDTAALGDLRRVRDVLNAVSDARPMPR